MPTLTPTDLTYGIEIECITRPGRTREDIFNAIAAATGGDRYGYGDTSTVVDPRGRTWKVVNDGSVIGDAYAAGHEIVSPILNADDLVKDGCLQKVIRAVAEVAKVNETCGIHIHIGHTALDTAGKARLARIWWANEEIIFGMIKTSDRRKATFCKPIDGRFIAEIATRRVTDETLPAYWYGMTDWRQRARQHYDYSRYAGMNFHAIWQKGTIEFRIFNGSLHAGQIRAHTQFVAALICKAANTRTAPTRRHTINPAATKAAARSFLRSLGLDGPEYKTLRTHYLEGLTGWAAFAAGRPSDAWTARHGRGRAAPAPALAAPAEM